MALGGGGKPRMVFGGGGMPRMVLGGGGMGPRGRACAFCVGVDAPLTSVFFGWYFLAVVGAATATVFTLRFGCFGFCCCFVFLTPLLSESFSSRGLAVAVFHCVGFGFANALSGPTRETLLLLLSSAGTNENGDPRVFKLGAEELVWRPRSSVISFRLCW